MTSYMQVLFEIDWSTVFCAFAYITSSAALPIVSRLLFTDIRFAFPATLAAAQAVAVALCLMFWTLLSIFRPRTIRLSQLLPLSVMHSLVSLSHMHNLCHNSLLHYQLARFVPLIALSWATPLSSSAFNWEDGLVRSTRATFVRGVFIFVSAAILLLHPPASPLFFTTAVIVPFFDLNGYPKRLRASTLATDLQLQLFTRSLSSVFLCFSAPKLDTINNAQLLRLISNMITDLDRPTAFFLYSSGLLAFFTFVSVRVAHAKLEPYVFRTASILAAVPPLLLHFLMEHTSDEVDGRTVVFNEMLIVVDAVRRGVDVTLIIVLLATVYRITVSTMPEYSSAISGTIDDEESGGFDGGDNDDNDHEFNRVDNNNEMRLGEVYFRNVNGSCVAVDRARNEHPLSSTTWNNADLKVPTTPL